MTLTALPRAAAFAALVVNVTTAAAAQTTSVDPHHPDTTIAQATPPAGMTGQGPGAQPGQPGMMGQGMGGMMQPRMMGQGMMGMSGPRMKIMFAIADVNSDGALSFEEVTAIHKRIFDQVDANKDGKVTPEEARSFMQE
jgi:hypothetical protein